MHGARSPLQGLLGVSQLVAAVEGRLVVRPNVLLAVGGHAGHAAAHRTLLPARAHVTQHQLPLRESIKINKLLSSVKEQQNNV